MGLLDYILGKKESKKRAEHAYVKLPRRRLIDVSLESTETGGVRFDKEKIERILEKVGKKRYTSLHTHPVSKKYAAFPSEQDLIVFLRKNNIRTMVIAQQDEETGKTKGYFLLRKTKRTKPFESADIEGLARDIVAYSKPFSIRRDFESGLKFLAKKRYLQYKFIPTKGFVLKKGRFVKKKGLEEKVVAAAILFIILVFFTSPNITGNMVTNLNSISSSFFINFILVCILGLVGLFYLKTNNFS